MVTEFRDSPKIGDNSGQYSQIFSTSTSHFVSGIVGGCFGVVAGHPFDTIKVRLQSQIVPTGTSGTVIQKATVAYHTTFQTLWHIVKEERIFGLFKGMTSPLVSVGLINAFLFSTYGSALELLKQDLDRPTYSSICIAGSIAGALNTLISCPMELAKIQLQNQLSHGKQLDSNLIFTSNIDSSSGKEFKSPLRVLVQNYRLVGLKGVFMGFWATFLREAPSYAVYFASYEYLCRNWSNSGMAKDISGFPLLVAGATSGVFAWLSTYPFDVLKTKIQAQRLYTPQCYIDRKYHGWIQASVICHREEGRRVFFRGLGATVIRAIPTNAFIFFGFSLAMRLFE